MNFPPTKRLRGLDQDVATARSVDDPFGDDEDFTQDDLDEIDIIASQAITSSAVPEPGSRARVPVLAKTWPTGASTSTGRGFGVNCSHRGNNGIRLQQGGSDRGDAYIRLEAQHEELKQKLKEVEEDIVLKSGEIRVLRDSLRGAQQEKEAQRQSQIQLETQRQKDQTEKEKDLNRKVQSLQSELQFKEAEINEMKVKLLSSDRNKMASPLARNSSKLLGSAALVHHGSGSTSSSPTGSGFITKETFGASVTPVRTRRNAGDRSSDPFLSVAPSPLQQPGGVLLGLLLQQPLTPSSLGLSHLLSMSLTDVHQLSSLSSGLVLPGAEVPPAAFSLVQSLALTGLHMLSQSRSEAVSSSRSCPGSVLLLPLLDLHLSGLCQALDSLQSTGGAAGRLEEASLSGVSLEDVGLAALRLLSLLLSLSNQVVEAVLVPSRDVQAHRGSSHNALLQLLLRLCEGGLDGSGAQREELVINAMKTLCVLIQRTPHTLSDRLQCVLPMLSVCLSAESRLQTVSQFLSVLTSLSDHHTLTQQLCSQHDPCVFLKLFQFIRTRSDKRASATDWTQLDLQLVRLLIRLRTQRAEKTDLTISCPCSTEVVQTVVVIFHRQWLDLRARQDLVESLGHTETRGCLGLATPLLQCSAPSLLRECLLLLHWLLLHHGSFSESCRPLLHLYDQVIPAVRETMRTIPELSESEDLALEEICRSEADDADGMDTDI